MLNIKFSSGLHGLNDIDIKHTEMSSYLPVSASFFKYISEKSDVFTDFVLKEFLLGILRYNIHYHFLNF